MTITAPDVDRIHEDLTSVKASLSPKQLRSVAMSETSTVSLWVGAVSAGKTFASLLAFLFAILRVPEGERIIIIGRTLKTIEGNVLSQLQDPKKFGPIAKLVVHTRGASTALIMGRLVELIGAPTVRAVGSIQGATVGLAYVDEATLLPDEEFWAMLLSRLRVSGARLLATTNPASANHWLRKNYILSAEAHDMIVFHLTMRDNPSLDRAYVLRMIRANVGMFFRRFILGLWTNAAGAIYDMWDESKHVIPWEDMPPIAKLLGVGIDVGSSHATSAVLLGLTDEYDHKGRWAPRLIAMDEWRYEADHEAGVPSMAPSIMAAQIRLWMRQDPLSPMLNQAPVRPGRTYVDPSAKGFRNELSRIRVQNEAADNDHAGISDIASLLANGRMIVTDRCKGILSEVTEYAWDPKATLKGLDEPVKLKDDSMDAWRYAVRSSRAFWLPAMMNAYAERY